MTTSTPDRSPHPDPHPDPAPAPAPTLVAARVAANRWRNSPRIRERLMQVAGLRQRGLSQAAIAGRLHVSAATISRDLRRLDLLWRQEHEHLANAERLQSLAGLREAARSCWRVIEKCQDDDDRTVELNAAVRSLTAIWGEIRQLLKHVRPPHPDDYWGYEAPRSPLRSRDALEERYEPPAKVVAGLLPYEDDPPDDDPKLADERILLRDLEELREAIEDGDDPATQKRLLESVSSGVAGTSEADDEDGGGSSRNGASRNGASRQLRNRW